MRRCRCPHEVADHRRVGTLTVIVRCQVPGCPCEFNPARRFAKIWPPAEQPPEKTLYERFAPVSDQKDDQVTGGFYASEDEHSDAGSGL